jgi:replicative DNA helicase
MENDIYDKQTEKALIGALFIGGYDVLDQVAPILQVADFYGEQHRELFETLIDIRKKKLPVDMLTVGEALKGKYSFADLIKYANSPASYQHAVTYAEIVKKKSMARQKAQQCREVINQLMSGADPEEIISKDLTNSAGLLTSNSKNRLIHVKDGFQTFLDELEERRANNGVVGISTGCGNLDEYVKFRNGSLYLLGARPKMGKTTLAVNIARNVAEHGIPVYFKSLEMTVSQIEEKLTSEIAWIDGSKLQNPARMAFEEWRIISGKAGNTLYNLPIWIDDKPGKASELIISLRKWKAENPRGFVVIDYLQRFKPESSRANSYEQTSETSNIICDAAKELDFPILALSQLSRDVEKRNDKFPSPADLRGSGSLEQDAAAVILLYRDDYYYPDKYPKPNDPSQVNVFIALNRFGETGIIDFDFYKSKSKFMEVK